VSDDAVPDAYIALAREIHAEVARIAADPAAHVDLLVEVFERASHEERARLADRIFAALEPERQWEVVARVFGDAEIRVLLEAQRAARLLCARALAAMALDSADIPEGRVLTVGLFREHDVRAAIARGHRSHATARRLVLRSVGDGTLQVLEDVFNPSGGHFVTGEYTEEIWRRDERLESHARVRVGAIVDDAFATTLYPGGRVDVEIAGTSHRGRLHLGFAMLGETDVFAP
jgi:hypothetical protein